MDTTFVASAVDAIDSGPNLPIFEVQSVDLQFAKTSDFVAAQIANNILILALQTGRIIRVDLDVPSEVDGLLLLLSLLFS